ncbi:MAG: DUF1697 domain-containing protein [Chloroherpetonaceae bacterium]|nr:DUF1697 domain-containing protein [Chloroherpetonaceae bacterium]
MKPQKYLALLRGINVGGNRIIKMEALRKAAEGCGFLDCQTYIQSGNLIFTTSEKRESVTEKLQETLRIAFQYDSTLIILPQEEIRSVVEKKPEKFGIDGENYKYDVLFLKHGIKAESIFENIPLNLNVEKAEIRNGVIYFTRNRALETKSALDYLQKKSITHAVTIRNWNTTQKLWEMIQG